MVNDSVICPECSLLPTHHKCKICSSPVCPSCCDKRGLSDLNNMLCTLCQLEKDCDDNDTSMATATATELFKYPTLPINKIINDATMSPRPEVAMMLNSKSLHDTPTSINFGTDTNTPVSLTSRSTTTNNAVSTNKTIAQTVTARKKPTVQSERRKSLLVENQRKKAAVYELV